MKRALPVVVFLVIGAVCQAQAVWFEGGARHSVEYAASINGETGFETSPVSCDISYRYAMPELFAESGLCYSGKMLDFTTATAYTPQFFGRLKTGPLFTYHLLSYRDVFLEQDMLAGLYFAYDDHHTFSFTGDVDFMYKWTRIYAVEQYLPYIANKSLAVKTRWNWFVLDHLDFYFGLGSYNTYDYKLFFAPVLQTGLDWRFGSGVTTGAEFTIQYIDMMTISSYFDTFSIRFFTKWGF